MTVLVTILGTVGYIFGLALGPLIIGFRAGVEAAEDWMERH